MSQPEKFWYFNNGITLVADEAAKAPVGASSRSAGVFGFQGASIVNGAQTVSTIGRTENDEALAHVRVSIRVIILKGAPSGFGNDVARTNNLQNRIEPRDFVAQDPEQRRIRQEMIIEGVDYQFVRGDDHSSSDTSCDLIEVTTALAVASGDSALAVQIKTGVGRFFSDLGRPPYRALFNPSVSGAKAFNAVRVHRHIESWIERKKKTLPKKAGAAWGCLIHGNRLLSAAVFRRLGTKSLATPIAAFGQSFDRAVIDTLCELCHAGMISAIAEHYPNRFLGVLFKNPSMSKTVFDSAVESEGTDLQGTLFQ